ncbi:signal peptidase I [Qipengyuania marisflavi]|uniref:Signal peptidase I n=1 Tax=Qipengyuania marisflavi TaxID=2486356 RepID=A0A5S3P6T5_9SPHN|nr:signal peptidase I [Qipengyuania marisflavi]TMM48948.1 signal peptidase I [Qipengyuania marisflavi]
MITGNPAAQPITKDAKTEDEKVDWLAELRGLALMLLAVVGFHSFIAKPFYIPSESMMPNLLVGDRLVVSKYPYGWNWSSISFHVAPRGDWRIWGSAPEYGDIVIPVHPVKDEDYIKRVVGLPGDRIAVRNGQIILNGQPVPQTVEPAIEIPLDANSRCNGFGLYDFRVTRPDGTRACQLPVYRETMPNGATYLVIDHENQRLDNFGEIRIPDDSVFVMGDNRDHSSDSRAYDDSGLAGPIPLTNIGGRAEFITFSLDGTTSLNPLSWFTSLRSGRAWSTLRPPLVERTPAE